MNRILIISIVGFLLLEFIAFLKETIHTAIVSLRLNQYLKKNHYNLWRDLTSFGRLGPGMVNSYKSLPWLFSEVTSDDEILIRLIDLARIRTRWFFITGGAFIATITTVFIGAIVVSIINR